MKKRTTTEQRETNCSRCGRAFLRGIAMCVCVAELVIGATDLHSHRDFYQYRPTTEIVAAATTTSPGMQPLTVNGQTFSVRGPAPS